MPVWYKERKVAQMKRWGAGIRVVLAPVIVDGTVVVPKQRVVISQQDWAQHSLTTPPQKPSC